MAFFIGSGIVLTQGGKYILVQEVRHEKTGFYNLPAGTVEIDEDFMQCIMREAKEETGVQVTLEHFLGIYQTVIASGSNVVFIIFSSSIPDDAVLQSDEHSVIQAFSYDKVLKLEQAGKLRAPTILKAIEDHRAGRLLPLSAVQAWHVDSLASITVEKDH